MLQPEVFCDTVSKPIKARHLRWCALTGAVVFGGAAFFMGAVPPFGLLGVAWIAGWLLGGVALLVPLVVLHEAAHWAAFRTFGAKNARFFWVMRNGKPVAPSITGTGKWLWRWQYAVVILAPTVTVSAVGIALMAAVPILRGAIAVALTLHLTGCINDWYVFGSVFRLPRGTKIEDRPNGFAYRSTP